MKKDTKENKKKILEILERNLGIVTPTCKEVGIAKKTFYEWYNNDPEFKKDVDNINDTCLDFVESQLFKKIKEGAEKSIHFYLAKKGKSRGYGDNMNINLTTNEIKWKSSNEDIEDEDEDN